VPNDCPSKIKFNQTNHMIESWHRGMNELMMWSIQDFEYLLVGVKEYYSVNVCWK
jgi:hypothetical protein